MRHYRAYPPGNKVYCFEFDILIVTLQPRIALVATRGGKISMPH